MASIRAYKTNAGEQRYEVRYRDTDNTQRSRTFSVKKDAHAFKLDSERKRQAGHLYQARPEPIGKLADQWLERYKTGAHSRTHPRPSSVETIEQTLKHLEPLRQISVERLTRATVEDLASSVASRAPRRAHMALALLKRILRAAEGRGQPVNPAVYDVRIAKPTERQPIYLTWPQAEELQTWLPEHTRRIIPITILTALRRGEILALRDTDIDLNAGSITISGQLLDGERVPTKTAAGTRTIDIGPHAIQLIQEQQAARAPNPHGLLFPSPEGHPWDPHNFMHKHFKPAARHAGIPRLTFHDLRHTGASLMIAAGIHARTIAHHLGHTDGGALLLKRYGHLYKGATRQAALELENHLLTERKTPERDPNQLSLGL